MSSEQGECSDEPPIDPLLSRMVSDPRISVAQAAQILGKTQDHVYRSSGSDGCAGEVSPTSSAVGAIRRASVPLTAAPDDGCRALARRHSERCPPTDHRRQADPGAGLATPGYEADDVRILSRARTRLAGQATAQRPEGHVNTLTAPQILGLSVSRIRQLASSEQLPAIRQQGR